MTKPNDGGYAYPSFEEHPTMDGDWKRYHYTGMTLRDWFAGQALTGMLSYYNGQRGDYHTNASPDAAAKDAYHWADAMLKAREKGGER